MRKTCVWAGFVVSMLVAMPAQSQGWLGKMKDKVKERAQAKVEQKLEDGADTTVGRAMDQTQNVIVCLVSDRSCISKARDAGKQVAVKGADGKAVSSADSASAVNSAGNADGSSAGAADASTPASAKPGEGAWANYDFVPGDRMLFADDFSTDRVGNFPQRLKFKSGNMEIVEWQGARWLSADGTAIFAIPLPEVLPQRFTMEFEVIGSGNALSINFTSADVTTGPRIAIDSHTAWLRGDSVAGRGELAAASTAPMKIRISVDGGYLKLYANEHRALNVPTSNLGRSKQIYIDMNGWSAKEPRMIRDIRIAAGGRQLYDALADKGRVATHGILFATASAEIQGESTPTLKEIGGMLTAHPELKLMIEGHTDNVGAAATNQTLSEQRALAVKQYLVSTYGIDATRLGTSGFGASKPTSSNDTPEGRQNNRRVELVKM